MPIVGIWQPPNTQDADSLESRCQRAFLEHTQAVLAPIVAAGFTPGQLELGSGFQGREGWTGYYAEVWTRADRRMLGKVWIAVVESPFSWQYHHEVML